MALARKHGGPVRWNEERTENALATIHGRGQIQHIELAADADGKLTAAARAPARRHGRLPPARHARHPAARRLPLRRRLRPARRLRLRVHVGVHHDDADRRLPRRRPSRGDVRHRAGDGRPRREDRRRPARAAPAQLHPHRVVPVHRVERAGRTTPATTTPRRTRRSSWSTTTSCAPDSAIRTSTAPPSASASASRPTSRCAASPRRGCWPRSTTRPAAGRRRRCACCRPARCRSSPAPSPHGQGHETSWSMIVADRLGVSPDDVDVLHSDTAIARSGSTPTGRARSPSAAWRSRMACDKVIDKAKQIAAHQLEANADDLEFAGGVVHRAGFARRRTMPLAAIAFEAFTAHDLPDGVEPNLEAQRHLRPAELLVAVRHAHLRRRGRQRDRRRSTSCSTSRSTTAACRSTR